MPWRFCADCCISIIKGHDKAAGLIPNTFNESRCATGIVQNIINTWVYQVPVSPKHQNLAERHCPFLHHS